jgi:hypothetical protein
MQNIPSVVYSLQSNLYYKRAANESLAVKAIFFLLSEKCSAFMVAHAAQNFFFQRNVKVAGTLD